MSDAARLYDVRGRSGNLATAVEKEAAEALARVSGGTVVPHGQEIESAANRQEPRPATRHNALAPRITDPIPPDAMLCRYHGWHFPWFNAGGLLVCRECMLDDGACAVYTPEGL